MLKEDFAEFAKEDRIKDIIKKYSAFVQFPVSVNGEKSIRSMPSGCALKTISRTRNTTNSINSSPMISSPP